MSKTKKNQQQMEWTEEGYEQFLESHPDYPIPEPIERLNLVMKRENALAIISGEKRVEFRTYTQHYVNRLYDKDTENFTERHKDEPEVVFWCDALRPVESIRFHDRNHTWALDVECTYNDLVAPTDEGVAMLHDEYDCHEMDEMHRRLKREGADRFPLYFYFELGEVQDRIGI